MSRRAYAQRPVRKRGAPAGQLHIDDLLSQLESLLDQVWRFEAAWRRQDRIDQAIRHAPARSAGAISPFRRPEEARIPLHVVATDVVTGRVVVLPRGAAIPPLMASAAIPRYFLSFESAGPT